MNFRIKKVTLYLDEVHLYGLSIQGPRQEFQNKFRKSIKDKNKFNIKVSLSSAPELGIKNYK